MAQGQELHNQSVYLNINDFSGFIEKKPTLPVFQTVRPKGVSYHERPRQDFFDILKFNRLNILSI
jgi:hypothetical protein